MNDMTESFTQGVPNGRRLRLLTLVDTATRECAAIEVGQLPAEQRVVAVLGRLNMTRSLPQVISVDNDPAFILKALDVWAYKHGVQLKSSRLATPTDNPYIDASNGRLREECLDQHWFAWLEDARRTIKGCAVTTTPKNPMARSEV